MLLEAVGIALGVVFIIALVIAFFALGLLAIIVEYIWVPIAAVLCIGLVSCTIRQSYIAIKSRFKKKVVEKELD